MRLRLFLPAISLVALVLASFSDASLPALAPSDQGRLVFTAGLGDGQGVSGDPLANAIFTARTDGTHVRRLGSGSVSSFGDPVWSPDGSLIAYDTDGGIGVMRSDGSGKKHLCSYPCMEPAWSPDGSKIAYVLANTGGIGVMRADGSHKTIIRRLPHAAFYLDWSPDGKMLAFQVAAWPWDGTYVIHPDGTGLQKIESSTSWGPKWSPVGTRLLLSNSDGIHILDLPTNKKTLIVHSPDHTNATWSPDGRQVAYGDLHGRISVRDLKTGHTRQLTLRPSPCSGVTLGKIRSKPASCSPWAIIDIDWTARP